jgi:hypothetical protein
LQELKQILQDYKVDSVQLQQDNKII